MRKKGMKTDRKGFNLVLAGLLMALILIVPQYLVQAATKNGVAKGSDEEWHYYVNGKIQTSYNSLAKYNGDWWYMKHGTLDFSYTGLCKYNQSWWYVSGGKVNFKATGLYKYNGNWWYVKNGKVDFNATGLYKYNGNWWYVKNGKIDFEATGLYKHNGNWWYVKNGKINFKATGLYEHNGSWWYVKSGKIDFKATGLYKHNGAYWYVKNGKFNPNAAGLYKYNGSWWYVKSGKIDFSYTGYTKYNGTYWYVKNGKMIRQAGYCGMKKNSSGTWVYYQDGKVLTNYTGMAKNNYGWWYFKKGKIDFNYTGLAKNDYGWWYFKKGKINFSFTGVVRYNDAYWYCENGTVNFNVNKRIKYDGATFDVEEGRAYVVGKNKTGYYNTPESPYEKAYRTGNLSGLWDDQKEVYKEMSKCIAEAEKYKTVYEKEKAVHDYIIKIAEYDYDTVTNMDSGKAFLYDPFWEYGVFVNKKAVCNGYADAFYECMWLLGIPCEIVTNSNHAWNAVQLNGEWYQVDLTWDDPSYCDIRYKYFNVTDEYMKQDHQYSWSESATSKKYSYANMELVGRENYFENDAKKFSAYLNKKIEAGITELECYFTGDIEDFDVFMNKAELKEGWHYSSYSYSKMSDYYKANITLTYNSKEIEQKKLAEENLRKFQSQENYFYNVEDYFAYVTKMVENGEHYITCYVDTEVKNPSRCLDFSKVPDCKMDDYQFDEVLGGGYYLVYLYNDTLYHTFQVLKRQDNYFYNTEDFYAYVNQQVVKGEKQIVCYIDLSIDDLWEFTRTSQVNGSVTGISYGTNKYYHTVEFRVE